MAFEQLPIPGPFKGIIDNLPRPTKPFEAFDDIQNFLVYKGRLITRPKLDTWGNPPDGAILRNAVTFQDILNNYHTLMLTTQHAYYLSAGPVYNVLTLPGGMPDLSGTALPYGYGIVNGRIYFSNGSRQGLYTDGEITVKDSTCPGAWRHAIVIGNHLLVANMTEAEPGAAGSTRFQNRIRWAASGNPNDWTGFSSGFTDLLDVPDGVTGLSVKGRSGYVYRSNGLNLITVTGVGTSPFRFDPLSNAPQGVGCYYPYTLASYGGVDAFVAQQDIYLFDGTTFSPIGTEAKTKIFADIALASGDVIAGWIVPNLGTNFDFLSYWISIPGVDVTWVYSWDDKAWTRFVANAARMTCIASIAVS